MIRFSRLALTALGLAALASPAIAQNPAGRPTFGLYGGLNYTKAEGRDVSDAAYRAGFLGGGFLVWELNDRFGIQPEVQFSQEGTKFNSTENGTSVTGNFRIDYIQIPVLLRFNPTRMAEDFNWHFVAGPLVAFKTSCGLSMSPALAGAPTSCKDIGTVESTDYGAMAGAGVDFKVGGQYLTVSGRYHFGMPDIVKDNNGKNRGFSLMLGTRW